MRHCFDLVVDQVEFLKKAIQNRHHTTIGITAICHAVNEEESSSFNAGVEWRIGCLCVF